jgi:hypothetical protein
MPLARRRGAERQADSGLDDAFTQHFDRRLVETTVWIERRDHAAENLQRSTLHSVIHQPFRPLL